MTVKQLMEQLAKADPDAVVYHWDYEACLVDDLSEIDTVTEKTEDHENQVILS